MVDILPTLKIASEPGTYAEAAKQDLIREQIDLASRPYTSPFSNVTLDPQTGEVVRAWWRQESLLGDAVSFLEERSAYSGEEDDPDFNPYAFFKEHQSDYLDITAYLDQGLLDHARGPRQFAAIADSIRGELERKELMEQGGTMSTILGVGGTLLSPELLIPVFGAASRANVARKALTLGASGAGIVAGEELIHHQQQRTRTLYESIMGIGATGVLLGGMGVAGHLIGKRWLGPDNPNNPLREENLGPDEAGSEVAEMSGKSVSESMADNGTARMSYDPEKGVQLELFPEPEDIAALRSARQDLMFDPTETATLQRTRFERAVDWTQGKIGFTRSPTTVAAHTASSKARTLLTQMAEMGLHTVEMAAGATRRLTAEMHKDVTVLARQQAAEETMTNAWYGVMRELGAARGSNEFIAKGYSDFTEFRDVFSSSSKIGASRTDPQNLKGIPLPEFQYQVWRRLNGDMTPHPNAVVERGIIKATQGYRGFTQDMFQRAVRTGLLSDKQQIENYFPQIWDADAIIADGAGLKRAFIEKFSKTDRFIEKPDELDQFVDDLVEKLSNRNDIDITDGFHKGSDFILGKSGRVKARDLLIAPDELSMFQQFLHKDVSRVMKQYADDMGGRITLREFFGDFDPKTVAVRKQSGETFDELTQVVKEIREEFSALRKAAHANKEDVQKLNRDQDLVERAVLNLRDRLINTDRRPTDGGWGSAALYTGRMARRTNYLRFMGSVMLASLTDMATISLSHGAGKHLVQMGRNFGRIAKEAKHMNNRELSFLLFGAESALSQSRTAKLVGIDDAMYHSGFGSGKARKVSGAIEGVMNWGSSKMNILNLMHYWNSRHKMISGHVVLGNILDDAAAMAQKGAKSKYKWRELGLSDDVLKRIHSLTQKHGFEEQRAGVSFRWPDTSKWHGEIGGFETEKLLHAALRRAVDRAVITPGIADLPMFHSTELGQLLFQFNSFGFAAVNKFMRNLNNSAVNGRQLDALMSVTWALGMGAAAFYIREGIVKGRFEDGTMPEETGTIVYESIDRSGLMMWGMPYVNSMMKLAAGPLSDAGVPIQTPSRYAAQQWYQSLFGPTFGGLGGDVLDMAPNLAEGEIDKVGEKMKRLIPYRNVFHFNLLHRLAWGDD